MKRKLKLILALVLVLSITACANDDGPDVDDSTPPVEESEEPEDDTDVDKEQGDQEEPETTPENEVSDKWPDDFMPQAPKLAGEIVVAKEEGPKKMFLEFDDISHNEASDYVDSIKEAGFTDNTNEENNSNIVKYKGMDKEKNLIVFIWKEEITKLELIKKD